MAEQQTFEFDGDKLTVSWDGRLCIHVQECTRAHGELFKSGRQPWGEPDRADADHVAAVVRRCPTGALTYERKDGGAVETPAPENTATIANNGPVYVNGDIHLEGAPDDMPGVRTRVALCRCGHSQNKPFCDNAHEKVAFRDRGAIDDTGDDFETAGGKLEITPVPNGPLIVAGNLTIRAASGRAGWRGTKTALCRCGSSQSKPFCDGGHKAAGFKSD